MSLVISYTGVRSGEYIVGADHSKQCKGSLMQIRGTYPPSKHWVSQLSPVQLRDQLTNYGFFRSKTSEQRLSWLLDNGTTNEDLYLEDIPDLHVKIIRFEGEFIVNSLSEEQINQLIAGNPDDPDGFWPIREVFDMFPRNPRSKAKKHTLVFRPNNWALQLDRISQISSYTGIHLNVESGAIAYGSISNSGFMFKVAGTSATSSFAKDICIVSNQSNTIRLTYEHLESLCRSLDLNTDIMREISLIISWFSPSVHKSLIQKLIRTRSVQVRYREKLYPSREFLATSFCMLMVHPGVFNPDIQRFVSGIESALKRLAVAICEDSYLESPLMLSSLLAGAWIVQNESTSGWIPSDSIIQLWIRAGLDALKDSRMFQYDWHKTSGVISQWDNWSMNYYLLDIIRSFNSDIQMFLSIADHHGVSREVLPVQSNITMPVVHCIDHHSYTGIAHYISLNCLPESYSGLFTRIWNEVVGYNSRKDAISPFDSPSEFQLMIRQMQEYVWLAYSQSPQSIDRGNESTISFPYRMSESWLASFIGPFEYRLKSGIAIVVMHPDNLLEFTVVKRPSRGKDPHPELSEEDKSRVIEQFKKSLTSGIKLANVPATLPTFKDTIVYLKDDEYYIQFAGSKVAIPWTNAINLTITLPVHSIRVENYLTSALNQTGTGMVECAPEFLEKFIRTMPVNALKRTLIYISDYGRTVELYHIGRDGKGTEYSVSIDDIWVHHLLCAICAWYPGALEISGGKFKVKNGPVMWMIANVIRSKSGSSLSNDNGLWPVPIPETRRLWDHQIDAIQRLVNSRLQGKKLRIIWITPGLGKTAIITNYISRLIQEKKMLKWCLYTLPPSALESIQKEFMALGLPYRHIDMRESAKGDKRIVPWVVNFVFHDHLRMADLDFIKECGPNLLFINDEFHKTIATKTIRTSVALEVAHVSTDVICLTGTLIKDTSVEPLIAWISQSVDFEITPKNYWVAVSSIISRKIETKTVVERLVVESNMTPSERSEYYSLVPSAMGGTATSINFKRAVELSYHAISREILSQTMYYVNLGMGVFVIARNIAHQKYLRDTFVQAGVPWVQLIEKDNYVSYTPTHPPIGTTVPNIIITTPKDAEGYNLSRYTICITGVYFSNEATREQLERRINRIDQTSPVIRIVIIHSGIVSYIHLNYEKARSLRQALLGFARDVQVDIGEIL